jgi:hypothetical protein
MLNGLAGARDHRIIPGRGFGSGAGSRHIIRKMNWQELSKHALRFVALLIAAAFAYWLLRATGLYEFTARERDGLNTLILLIGNIYAVMFAFVIFVIWGQFTDVENFIMRECNSLRDLMRFGEYLSPEADRTIRRAVEDYVHRALKSEWEALGERRRDKQAERAFAELVDEVVEFVPATPSQEAMHARLIEIARRTGEHRDDRIAKSLTQIPPTLIRLVDTMASALLLLVFVYPFHHWLAGLTCFGLLALVLFLANLVMRDTDNPFNGIWNVSSKPFSDLLA